ncbi:ATP-dependent DNA helicase [Lophium mytilinum]|uniref:DNA 3'-5' helicase n=1 Tax=Lophium mytilinum TaxID=390894 RepID=A0A6A6QUQ3_9PEZI|nr:ATP-dependent DNA helicase [Lophium mytilinum]
MSDDEFGFDSDDDDALFEAAQAISNPNSSRKRSRDSTDANNDLPLSKKPPPELLSARGSDRNKQLALKALKENFGFDAFRLEQAAVISRLLDGGSATVIFPTGGGKSLCYQIPALVFGELDKQSGDRAPHDGGITIVVSPLIALMKDQVDALVRRKVKAAVLDSTRTREQFIQTNQDLQNGTLKLLYCAPERLNNEGFVESMKLVRGGVRLLAVDEAHCVSEWGHSFRPDYLKVARFATEIKAERVICLTATATPKVATDICTTFGISPTTGLFRTPMYRPNLRLLASSSASKDDSYPELIKFLRKHSGPTIIYVTVQKQTEALAGELCSEGFKAESFHAGMLTEKKTQVQDRFMQNEDMIIVATIAFGMGIDKSNIRNIVHYNIPQSVEEYSQQIGRAGRDGKQSVCMFFLSPDDFYLRNVFTYGDLPSKVSIRNFLREVFSPENVALGIGEKFSASHTAQCNAFDIKSSPLSVIYAQLELQFSFIRATTPIYSKYQYEITDYGAYHHADNDLAAKSIRASALKAKKYLTVDVDVVSSKPGLVRADIVGKLSKWNESGIISLKTSGVQNVYIVQRKLPSTDAEINAIADKLYSEMVDRESQALQRTKEVVGLVTGKKCFSRALAAYFADDSKGLPDECGHCTWCETHQQVVLPQVPPQQPDPAMMDRILKVCPQDDPLFLARVAFGIASPRSTQLKLKNNPVFGSMPVCDFKDLVRAFIHKCTNSITEY